jgi:hypothetical protein
MEEFLRTYGVWILLIGVFFAMHWFGAGCGASHRRAHHDGEEPKPQESEEPKREVTAARRGGGCH